MIIQNGEIIFEKYNTGIKSDTKLVSGLDFDTVASMKIAVMSSGVMTSMDILEEVDMKSIVTKAKTASENYKKPGE